MFKIASSQVSNPESHSHLAHWPEIESPEVEWPAQFRWVPKSESQNSGESPARQLGAVASQKKMWPRTGLSIPSPSRRKDLLSRAGSRNARGRLLDFERSQKGVGSQKGLGSQKGEGSQKGLGSRKGLSVSPKSAHSFGISRRLPWDLSLKGLGSPVGSPPLSSSPRQRTPLSPLFRGWFAGGSSLQDLAPRKVGEQPTTPAADTRNGSYSVEATVNRRRQRLLRAAHKRAQGKLMIFVSQLERLSAAKYREAAAAIKHEQAGMGGVAGKEEGLSPEQRCLLVELAANAASVRKRWEQVRILQSDLRLPPRQEDEVTLCLMSPDGSDPKMLRLHKGLQAKATLTSKVPAFVTSLTDPYELRRDRV